MTTYVFETARWTDAKNKSVSFQDTQVFNHSWHTIIFKIDGVVVDFINFKDRATGARWVQAAGVIDSVFAV